MGPGSSLFALRAIRLPGMTALVVVSWVAGHDGRHKQKKAAPRGGLP